MKKLDFLKYVAIFAAFIALFFAGCGEKDDEIVDGTDPNNPNNPNGEIIRPKEPPSMSPSDMDRQPTECGSCENTPVETENVLKFISALYSDFDNNCNNYNAGLRAQDEKRPEEYYKIFDFIKEFSTKYGYTFGHFLYTWKYENLEENAVDYGYEIETYNLFNFSNCGNLYSSGAFGYLWTYDEDETGKISSDTLKINGKINFAGKYKGKVVFDNVTFVDKHKRYEYDGDYGSSRTDTIIYKIISGEFYVQSEGKEKIKLSDTLLPEIIYLYYYLYYDRRDNYGDDPITIDKKMPTVPNAPKGSLSERVGASVNSENVKDFFREYTEEFGRYGGPRAANEIKFNGEELSHGRDNGYLVQKYVSNSQFNNSDGFRLQSGTEEYNDYSNKGVLYFGGGYGQAVFYRQVGNYSSEECGGEQTVQITGKLNFNGKYKGTLDFQDFKYNYGFQKNYTYNGSVKIGDLDVSEKYLEYIVKERPIYAESKSGEIVGVYGYENFVSGKTYPYTLFLESDKTGVYQSSGEYRFCVSGTGRSGGVSTGGGGNYFTYEFDETTKIGIIYFNNGEDRQFTFDGNNTIAFDGKSLARK
ncbi:MAG: hypothetical protein FWF51_07720 [Chitinivibrionia bacterium]|nr:hypothetical protein [Chitinivibrionia bacterium]